MAAEEKFSEYFGFTESEVDLLYQRYCGSCNQQKKTPAVTREGLRIWYDGYYTKAGDRMYNPRSVAASLTNENLGSYWTSAGPYDEIFYYIEHNVADVRNDLALMISGESVPAKIREYAATSMNLNTREEILSAMVVYGFLSYYKGRVSIPNRELSAIVNLVYLSARDRYRIEREDKAGAGFVDFIFYPEERGDTCIILELKAGHTPEEAIRQIKEKQYAIRFKGKLGEKSKYTGKILAVGISYDKKTKVHKCRMEEL